MAKRMNQGGRTGMKGMGWGLGVGAAIGALATWVAADMNKADSTIRRWIDIGRRKRERIRLEDEVKHASEAAAAVEGEIMVETRRTDHLPPDEMPI